MTATAASSGTESEVRPSKVLSEAGFSAVSRLALAMCRLCSLNFARAGKYILPRRAISLLSLAGKPGKTTMIELTVYTTGKQSERRAVDVMVRYFGFLGHEICGNGGSRFSLFADPLDDSDAQGLYSNPPVGAFWTLVTIQRQADTRRIGIFGSLCPKPVVSKQPLALDAALVSRDRRALEHHLSQASESNDRKTAMQLLSRMIFLERRADDIRAMRFIADIDQVMTDFAGEANAAGGALMEHCFTSLSTAPFDNSVLLSKWLASEAISLRAAVNRQACGDDAVVSVPPGPNRGLRALTAVFAGYLIFSDGEQSDIDAEPEQIPWVKPKELLSILISP